VERGMTNPDVTEERIRAAINTIVDPCSRAAGAPAGLDDMGLVRKLDVWPTDTGVGVHVVIGVTEYGCLLGPAFATQVQRVLGSLPGVEHLTVDLDAAFDWLPEDMSAAYQAKLAGRRQAGRAYFLPASAVVRSTDGQGPRIRPETNDVTQMSSPDPYQKESFNDR
jgi:metal-sulfur cluster biosynthetic enzyme